MKVVIESSYDLRDRPIHSYHSFPKFSSDIEKTMISQLEFLQRMKRPYTLKMTVTGG